MITLTQVSFFYKNKPALLEVDLQIGRGESVAVLGPNGSGKSTLFRLLNGLIFPGTGSYRFDGQEITDKRLKDSAVSKRFHQRVGFVFQHAEAQLFCSTVEEEIAFGPLQMGLPEAEVSRRVEDCLALLDIAKLRDEHPLNLSGGEKKRTAFAAVLAMNPEVLVLDEPMNGIDPRGRAFLRELLLQLAGSKTLLVATHDYSYMEGIFNRAVVFSENHRLIRDDTYDRVLKDRDFLAGNNLL